MVTVGQPGCRSGVVWRWVRGHWLDLMLPPAAFLLAAGIYRQVEWMGHGRRDEQASRHYRASLRAEGKGDRQAALREAAAAAQVAPEDSPLLTRLSTSFQRLGRPEQAAQSLERALRAEKSPSRDDYLLLAQTWRQAGRDDAAERVLREQVLPRWPDSTEAWFLNGLVRMRRDPGEQGLRQAADSFARVLRRTPEHPGALYQYGVCLSRLGRPAEAERALRKAVERAPALPAARYALAQVLRKQGKTRAARQALAEFQRLEAVVQQVRHLEVQRALKRAAPRDLLQLAGLELSLDQLHQAESVLTEYLVREPTDPRGHRKLAEVYRRTRDPQKAVAAERLAVALEPKGPS